MDKEKVMVVGNYSYDELNNNKSLVKKLKDKIVLVGNWTPFDKRFQQFCLINDIPIIVYYIGKITSDLTFDNIDAKFCKGFNDSYAILEMCKDCDKGLLLCSPNEELIEKQFCITNLVNNMKRIETINGGEMWYGTFN